MYCQKCGKENDGKFCKLYGEKQAEIADLQKSVTAFIVGLVVLFSGIISFAIGFFTMLSDLTLKNYIFKGYDYIGPHSAHEIVMIFFTFVGFWCVYIGIVMVSTNKSEAACVKSSYKTTAHIAYAVSVVLFVCAFIVAIPHFHEGGYFGVSAPEFLEKYALLSEFFGS